MIKEFDSPQFGTLRTVLFEGEVCFSLKDLTRMLGIKSMTECRTRVPSEGIKIISVNSDEGEKQNHFFITEKCVKDCFFQSSSANAEEVMDWVYRTVLPEMQSYKRYNVDELKVASKALKFLEAYEDLKVKVNVLETHIKVNQPKLQWVDRFLGSGSCVDLDRVHEVLKFKGIKHIELLRILRAVHVLNELNIPYQEYCDRKYFRVVEAVATTGSMTITTRKTFVYQSGISFIERILKEYEGDSHGRELKR